LARVGRDRLPTGHQTRQKKRKKGEKKDRDRRGGGETDLYTLGDLCFAIVGGAVLVEFFAVGSGFLCCGRAEKTGIGLGTLVRTKDDDGDVYGTQNAQLIGLLEESILTL
jgi:hypothetical protein